MHAYIVAFTSNVIKAQAKTTYLHPVVWPEVVHTHYCILCGRIKNINNTVSAINVNCAVYVDNTAVWLTNTVWLC